MWHVVWIGVQQLKKQVTNLQLVIEVVVFRGIYALKMKLKVNIFILVSTSFRPSHSQLPLRSTGVPRLRSPARKQRISPEIVFTKFECAKILQSSCALDGESAWLLLYGLNEISQSLVQYIFGLEQSVTNIFEYSDIQIYWSRIYIRTFVRINFSFTNIFGHSFVSNLFVRIYSDICWWVC